ncbi:MAG: SDR family NAD(P)-dependent oxidoreductase [Candidatus Promineifilaceae bacterium]
MRLANKTAIVTGSASGIGRGIAQKFAAEGAKVIVSDLNREGGEETVAHIREAGGTAEFVYCNITKTADTEHLAQAALDHFGRIDILVNNAGIIRVGTVLETSEKDWDDVIQTNLKGVFLCSKAVLPVMINAGKGAIINIASVGGLLPAAELAAYATAKAGVIHLSKQMARDYAGQWIRINCICPGTILTPMHDVFYTPETKDETLAEWAKDRPLQTTGTPEDIAYAAVYLASDEARFVTAVVLPVDGGIYGARG